MKKLFCVLLAVLVTLLPVAAMAEAATYARFSLTDPYIEFSQGEAVSTLDLKGLELALEAGTTGDVTGIIARVLANGTSALTASAEVKGTDLLVWAEGMSKALMIQIDQDALSALTQKKSANPVDLLKTFDGISLTDAGREKVLFLNAAQEVEANKVTLHLTDEQLDGMINDLAGSSKKITSADLERLHAADLTCDVAVWTSDDGANTRVESAFTAVENGNPSTLDGVLLMSRPDADTLYLSGTLTLDKMSAELSLSMQSDEILPEHAAVTATLAMRDGSETLGEIGFDIGHGLTDEGITHLAQLTYRSSSDEQLTLVAAKQEQVNAGLYVLDLASNMGLGGQISYQQTPNETGGTLDIALAQDDSTFQMTTNVSAATVDGAIALPDLFSKERIDMQQITEADRTLVETDLQMIAFRALGALVGIPGLKDLAASMM